MNKILLVGASGQARSVIDCLKSNGQYGEISILVDNEIGSLLDCSVIGSIQDAKKYVEEYRNAHIAMGDNAYRSFFYEKLKGLGYEFPIVQHKTAYLSDYTQIGEGTVLHAKSFVNASSIIGRNCIINTNVNIEHDCVIGNHVHISPGTTICGGTVIGDYTWIGAGTVIKDHVTIGTNSIIGAGSVVVGDLESNAMYYGCPAKKQKTL